MEHELPVVFVMNTYQTFYQKTSELFHDKLFVYKTNFLVKDM